MNIGLISGLVAMFSWGTADFITKFAYQKINVREWIAWSTLFLALIPLAAYPFFGKPISLNLESGVLLMGTAIFLGIGNILFLKALSLDSLSLITSLGSAYPALTITLGVVILGEVLAPLEIIGIVFAVVGVIIASIPKESKLSLSSGVAYILIAEIFWGVGFFLHKITLVHIDWYTTQLGIGLIQAIIIWPFVKKHMHTAIKKRVVPLIFVSMCLIALGLFVYSFGVSLERVSIVAPIAALFPLTAILLGAILLKERLHLHQYAGIAIVITGIFILSV